MNARIEKLERSVQRLEIWAILGLCIGIIRIIQIANATPPPASAPHSSGNSHVQIATAPETIDQTRRDYFTVEDVAEREGIANRTVLTAIEQGRILPAPEKSGRAWIIDKNYRYLPPATADSRR